MDKNLLLQMTADIVASHASMNELSQSDLLGEIDLVFSRLAALAGDAAPEKPASADEGSAARPLEPAVPLAAAFASDRVFCMVCGKGMKTLKRHISTAHGMKPGQYRKAFGIPAGTSLVAREYSEARQAMAQTVNLAARLEKARAAKGKGKKK